MKKKFVRTLAFVLACILCLPGCGSNGGSNTVSSTTDTTNTANTEEPAAFHPQQITQEICENLSIDAKAVIPSKTQYSTYTLKMVDSNPDRLFGIFSQDGPDSYTTEDRSYPGSSVVMYAKSDGQNLVVRDNEISYSAFNIELGENPMQEVANLMYYYTQEYPQHQPHDLSFMTVAEMEEYGRNILTELGIAWDPELNKCVTLTGQEILDFQKEMFGKSYYTEFGTPMTLAAAEDTCYLEFSFTYDGIPLLGSDEPHISSYVSTLPPPICTAVLMFNANGIQNCDVNFPCIVESASEPQTILSIDEAIAALKEKYDLEILFGSLKVTGIWMEYIPIAQGETTTLTPYWCFVAGDEAGYGANADRINAITGEDLAYGG